MTKGRESGLMEVQNSKLASVYEVSIAMKSRLPGVILFCGVCLGIRGGSGSITFSHVQAQSVC
jgi:hypothetical protein